MSGRYFLSFIEYGIQNPDCKDYVGGRLEITDNESDSHYQDYEVTYLTKKKDEFRKFRGSWDWKDVSSQDVIYVTEKILDEFNEWAYEKPNYK